MSKQLVRLLKERRAAMLEQCLAAGIGFSADLYVCGEIDGRYLNRLGETSVNYATKRPFTLSEALRTPYNKPFTCGFANLYNSCTKTPPRVTGACDGCPWPRRTGVFRAAREPCIHGCSCRIGTAPASDWCRCASIIARKNPSRPAGREGVTVGRLVSYWSSSKEEPCGTFRQLSLLPAADS